MRSVQHDVAAEIFQPYRDLAVEALAGRDLATARLLAAWDGTAGVESVAFAVLVRLREILARKVLAPYLAVCRDLDPGFRYSFRSIDRPLLAIIASADPSLLPRADEPLGWPVFLARCVQRAVHDLKTTNRGRLPRWGRLNQVGLRHPLSGLAPWSTALLGAKPRPQPGAAYCVRTCVPGFGAAGRAVVSPGTVEDAVFEMPGGQSGHPMSVHYTDRHVSWASAVPKAQRRQRRDCVSVLEPTGRGVPAPGGKESHGTRPSP